MYKFGSLGPGNIARKFVAAFRELKNVEVAAVVSTNRERTELFARQACGYMKN